MTEREKEKLSNTRNGTSLVEVEGGRERERERGRTKPEADKDDIGTNPDEKQWDGDRKDRRRDGAATSMDKKRRRLTD